MAKTKVVSFSELSDYRQCRLKHQLGWLERWRDPSPGRALVVGTLMHGVLEVHYGWLKDHPGDLKGAVAAVRGSGLLYDLQSANQTEEQELVEWMYDGHCEKYGADEDWEIVAVEWKDELWLPTERGTRSSLKLKVKIDLVVKDRTMGGRLFVVDHKTGRRLPKDKDLDLDDQQGLYTGLLRRRGAQVWGSITNAIRTEKLVRPMTLEERFYRPPTVRQDKELDTILLECMLLLREAHGPVHGDRPRSPDTERCGWKCSFTEACLAGRKGSDMRGMLADQGFEQDWERH